MHLAETLRGGKSSRGYGLGLVVKQEELLSCGYAVGRDQTIGHHAGGSKECI